MANSKGTSDQDIARPDSWREGRYQKSGRPVAHSVRRPPQSSPHHDTPRSTPVARKDHEPAVTTLQGGRNSETPEVMQVDSVTTWYRRKRFPNRR
jgi:hypothetical protein